METLNDFILKYYNKPQVEKYKPQIGRYSASSIYNIQKGYLNVNNYFDKKPIDMRGVKNIFRGCALEDMLQKVFTSEGVKLDMRPEDPNKQIKYELKIGDYILVVKPDFIFKDKDFVFEMKAPNKINYDISDWNKDQCECEYRATLKDVYLVKINIYADNDLPLFILIKYKHSDRR